MEVDEGQILRRQGGDCGWCPMCGCRHGFSDSNGKGLADMPAISLASAAMTRKSVDDEGSARAGLGMGRAM